MILRMLACTAVFILALFPASAQTSADAVDRPARPFVALQMSAVQDVPATFRATARLGAASTISAAPTLRGASAMSTLRLVTSGRRAGALAATVFRALSIQSPITLGVPYDEMDGYLRPTSPDDRENLFQQAKDLYEEAMTFRTDRYDLSLEPLNMKWRLKIRLSRLLMAESD